MARTLPPRRYVNWWGFKYGNNGNSFTKSMCYYDQRSRCIEANCCIFCLNRKHRTTRKPHAVKVDIDEHWAFENCRKHVIVRQDILLVKYYHGEPIDALETTLRAAGIEGENVGVQLSRKVSAFMAERLENGWRVLPRWEFLKLEEVIKRNPRGDLNPHGTDYVANLIKQMNPIVRSPKYANASNVRFENHQIFRTLLNWHNITPEQFARKWAKRPSFIHDLLSGRRDIYKEAHMLMYDAFGIPPEWWRNDAPLW